MVGKMKIFTPLILGLHLATVAFAADNCTTFNSSQCTTDSTCCAGLICDSSAMALVYDARKCLHACSVFDDNCTAENNHCANYAGGQCMYMCKSPSDCGSNYTCNPATSSCEPCGQLNDQCVETWMCCTGTCKGYSENPHLMGKCSSSKGFSLFDISFSPKQLVGFAVVMVFVVFL